MRVAGDARDPQAAVVKGANSILEVRANCVRRHLVTGSHDQFDGIDPDLGEFVGELRKRLLSPWLRKNRDDASCHEFGPFIGLEFEASAHCSVETMDLALQASRGDAFNEAPLEDKEDDEQRHER